MGSGRVLLYSASSVPSDDHAVASSALRNSTGLGLAADAVTPRLALSNIAKLGPTPLFAPCTQWGLITLFCGMNLQADAKTRSQAFLKARGIRVNEALPFIEAPEELRPMSAQDVARRSLVLGYMIGIGFRQPGSRLKSQVVKWGLYQSTSSAERALLEKEEYSQQEIVDATWLTECVQSLAWGLGMAQIDHFRRCDSDLGPKFPIMSDPSRFIASARLRDFAEIYFQSDLLYRLHWASRDDRMHGRAVTLDEGLIRERRKAMDWMLGVEPDWDEVPSDT